MSTRTASFANLPCVCICPFSVCGFCDRPFEVFPLSLSAQRRAEFDHCFEKKIDLRQGQPGKLLYLKGFALTADSETDKLACQIAGVGIVEREPANEVTQLLQDWRGGNRDAFDALLPIVYKELHRLAHFQLRSERVGHSLQSTALVHEAYLRLVGTNPPKWESRTHFFAVAAHLMRQILVDYARRHGAAKRGGDV